MDEDRILELALEIVRKRAASSSGLRIPELYRLYSGHMARKKSWPRIENRLRPVIDWLGDRPAMEVRILDCADYRAHRRETKLPRGKNGECYSDLTINFELQWLKCMYIWAVRGGRLPYSPLADLRDEKTKRHRATSPTEEEIDLLLEHADTVMKAVILLAADSGMRRDEIRLLHWAWYDEQELTISLPAAWTKSARDRIVPVSGRTVKSLAALPRHLRSPYVFTNPETEKPWGAPCVNARFRRIVSAAGIQAAKGDGTVHIHDLRHSYARIAARRGVRIEIISLILGHRNLQQTKIYIQTAQDDIADARIKFERGISAPRKPPQKTPLNTPDEHFSASEKGAGR